MQEDEAWLLDETQKNFTLAKKEILLEAIFKGGSDRSYYRLWRKETSAQLGAKQAEVNFGDWQGASDAHILHGSVRNEHHSQSPKDTTHVREPIVRRSQQKPFCILMHYGDEKEENRYYAEIAQFLREIKIPAPEIFKHDAQKKLIWMQDLGEIDLYSQRELPWEQKREGYCAVLRIIRKLHDEGISALRGKNVRMMEGFDEKLYNWEQNYFWEQTAQGVFGFDFTSAEKNRAQEELEALIQRLCDLPTCLVHRDFQSHNIMLINGAPYLIDFQGMRTGTRFYDLGSLLFDPYVELTNEQRIELLQFYYQLKKNDLDWSHFEHAFYEASMQRLMQALGAYGFLGLKRGKRQFLEFIPSALEHLHSAIQKSGNFSHLTKIITTLKETSFTSIGI